MKPPIIPPTDAIPIFSQKDTFSPGLVINSLAACEEEWINIQFRLNAIHSTYKAVHPTYSGIVFEHS